MVQCNICPQSFDDEDPLIEERKAKHEQWHTPIGRRRNTAMGEVKWLK